MLILVHISETCFSINRWQDGCSHMPDATPCPTLTNKLIGVHITAGESNLTNDHSNFIHKQRL